MSDVLFCPSCGSVEFTKKGFIVRTNKQRYQCKHCKKYFCNTTNTVMYKKKLIIHIGMNRDYLQLYLDWICFKSTITKKNIEKKIDQLEAISFLTKVKFRVKSDTIEKNQPHYCKMIQKIIKTNRFLILLYFFQLYSLIKLSPVNNKLLFKSLLFAIIIINIVILITF